MENKVDRTCHQYLIKKKYEEADLVKFKISKQKKEKLTVRNFSFHVVDKENKEEVKRVKEFIVKYEYLGTIPQRTTNMFYATYKNEIAAALIMSSPYAFSNIVGSNSKDLEQVLARGSSCSICPKNMGSWLITKSIRYCLKNPRAHEYGFIYQSLGAILVNKRSGSRIEYAYRHNQNKWFSSRNFRKIGAYKRYAKEIGYKWQASWNTNGKMNWDLIPYHIADDFRFMARHEQRKCISRKVPPKLKYIIIKGKDRREKRQLLSLFKRHNPALVNEDGSLGLPYPKNRGTEL